MKSKARGEWRDREGHLWNSGQRQGYRRVIRARRKAADLDRAAKAAGAETLRPELAISELGPESDRSTGPSLDGPEADQSRSGAQCLARMRGLEVLAMLGYQRAGLFPAHVTVADMQGEIKGRPCQHLVLLEALRHAGYLERDDHGYRLSAATPTINPAGPKGPLRGQHE